MTRLLVGDDPSRQELLEFAFGLTGDDADLGQLSIALGVDVAAYAARTPAFMSREQVRELASDGFTVGAHGRKHRSFEQFSPEDLEREIVASCEEVASITGQSRVPFAFPYSGLGVDRKVLTKILSRNEVVELVFDSGCLRNDSSIVVNRVFADSPARDSNIKSNVPEALRDAWSIPSSWYRRV